MNRDDFFNTCAENWTASAIPNHKPEKLSGGYSYGAKF